MVDSAGRTLHEFEGFRFALFQRRGGHPPELDNFDNLLVLGRTLGRIHAVGRAGKFRHRQQISVERMLAQSREFLLEGFIPKSLVPAYSTLTSDLLQTVTAIYAEVKASDMIRVHGDCHVGNILWRDDTAHFVDLDDCCTAPAIQDLWMFLSGERPYRELQLAELIEGYCRILRFRSAPVALAGGAAHPAPDPLRGLAGAALERPRLSPQLHLVQHRALLVRPYPGAARTDVGAAGGAIAGIVGRHRREPGYTTDHNQRHKLLPASTSRSTASKNCSSPAGSLK